jgi:hypothetical protein
MHQTERIFRAGTSGSHRFGPPYRRCLDVVPGIGRDGNRTPHANTSTCMKACVVSVIQGGHNCSAFPRGNWTMQSGQIEAPDTRLTMINPEPSRGTSRAVRSLAPDTGRYQHSACTKIEIYSKGDILVLCTNPKCPNKGANWALQEQLT